MPELDLTFSEHGSIAVHRLIVVDYFVASASIVEVAVTKMG